MAENEDFIWDKFALNLIANEQIYIHREGVGLQYTGKDHFVLPEGIILLTNLNIIYKNRLDGNDEDLIIPLSQIIYSEILDIRNASVLTLHMLSGSLITIDFKLAGLNEFYRQLNIQLSDKSWLLLEGTIKSLASNEFNRSIGISGIEAKYLSQDLSIKGNLTKAFLDLKSLQEHASLTLELCHSISKQIVDKTGNLSEDEIAQFKSHLLNLGLKNIKDDSKHQNVGRNVDSKLKSQYHENLAYEIVELILPLLEIDYFKTNSNRNINVEEENSNSLYNGYMTIPEAFCRINRARGLELVSPEDMIKSCHYINKLKPLTGSKEGKASLFYKNFENGLSVLCLDTLMHIPTFTPAKCDDAIFASETNPLLLQIYEAMRNCSKNLPAIDKTQIDRKKLSISADDMARINNIPVFIAKDRLLFAESSGHLSRDDSVEGLKFYLNLF